MLLINTIFKEIVFVLHEIIHSSFTIHSAFLFHHSFPLLILYLPSSLSILFCRLEFKAKLCAAKLRKALNSNEPVKIGFTVY
jgi:hypothetical protein